MKKEIMGMVNLKDGYVVRSDHSEMIMGTFRINNVSRLERHYIDQTGHKIDSLQLVFDIINDVEFFGRYSIESRDYDGIIAEIESYTMLFFEKVAEILNSNVRNGYINT